jgi:dipeptidyl aminopeptidase/acylaminoacyl peptidase
MPKTAPYGSWKSPITSDLIVAHSIGLSETRLDGDNAYWLEGRPREQGRLVVVASNGRSHEPRDLTSVPFNARTRVHEYGGASWIVADGVVYFSNFADQRLWRVEPGSQAPVALTAAPAARERQWRFADGIIDRSRQRWIGVREDHSAGGEAVNTIIAVDLAQPGRDAGQVLVGGHDFFAAPRLSPDGSKLLWLAWDHPNMPWNGTTLYLADLDPSGAIAQSRVIAGGASEAIFQPEWSPDGQAIAFVSDRSNWWNLHRYDLHAGTTESLASMAAEFGAPMWSLAAATYAFADSERIICSYVQGGLGHIAILDLRSKSLRRLDLPFTEFGSIRAGGGRALFRAAAPDLPSSIVALDLGSETHRVLQRATHLLDDSTLSLGQYLAGVQPVEFPTTDGLVAYGLFYPPHNADYVAPPNEKPPLLVKCHGGPTGAASSGLNLSIQFWTSRGIAVLDVNYGGSTGFGRDYRERLYGQWGVVDVDDCVNGAAYLAAQGLIDANRAVITGGSAGGYTTLAALAFRDFFQGGASHYGVSDAAALVRDTHKFESRYLDWLIGPYPQKAALYNERSPLFHADGISKPVIFFQGDEDEVVPPNQSEVMVEALRQKGIPVGYFLFSGEQHGFRKAGNIQRCLDAELAFYAIEVFKIGLTF